MQKLLLFFFCAWCFSNTNAQVGSLDPTFGTNGIKTYPAGVSLIAPDNSYYIADSYIDPVTGYWTDSFAITKYLSSGALDLSYGTDGVSERVYVTDPGLLAVQNDGKIVMATRSIYYGGAQDGRFDQLVFRFNTDGALDLSFNGTGYTRFDGYTIFGFQDPESLILNNDIIVVKGTHSSAFTYHYLTIYDMAGNANFADPISDTYSPGNLDNSYFKYAIALDGTNVYLSKDTYVYDQQFPITENYIEKIGDPSYGQNGRIDDNATLMGAHNGRLIIPSAVYNQATGNYGFTLRGYNPDGSPDINFNINGQQIADFASSSSLTPTHIVFQGDKIIVGGFMLNALTGKHEFTVARYNSNGILDASFDGDGRQTTERFDRIGKMSIEGNRLAVTGYQFKALFILEDDSNPITLVCSKGKTVYTDPGVCTALLKEIGPFLAPSPDDSKVNYTLSGATTASGTGTVSGLIFNKGVTTVTYSVIGSPSQTCTFNVTVKDKVLPVLTNVSATPTSLWPPNHQLRDVTINYTLTDNCPGAVVSLSVKSNEPQTGTGRSDLPNDWQVMSADRVRLRAERNELGTGRIYTITIKATDAAGNITKKEVYVTVPLNQGSHKQSYSSNSNMESLQVKVLSNPSKNYFTLQTSSNNNKPLVLRVTNAVGSVVETQSGVPANGQVQVGRNYGDGFYFAELIQGGQKVVVKLVKLR
ncbi:MAG: T9SS type A sorting domain-containing protein [Ferruginibacter sp.]